MYPPQVHHSLYFLEGLCWNILILSITTGATRVLQVSYKKIVGPPTQEQSKSWNKYVCKPCPSVVYVHACRHHGSYHAGFILSLQPSNVLLRCLTGSSRSLIPLAKQGSHGEKGDTPKMRNEGSHTSSHTSATEKVRIWNVKNYNCHSRPKVKLNNSIQRLVLVHIISAYIYY